jgi:hypothetical protein
METEPVGRCTFCGTDTDLLQYGGKKIGRVKVQTFYMCRPCDTALLRQSDLQEMPYPEYLLTPEWKVTRDAAVERVKGSCQICNGKDRLNVHHRNYDCLANEREHDLIVLCADCHHLFHRSFRLARN